MSSSSKANRSRIQQRRMATRRRKWIASGIAIIGVVVLVSAAFVLLRPGTASRRLGPEFEYSPADVAMSDPIVAIHEMGPGPSIPFLPASGPQPAIAVSEDFVDVGSVGPSEVVELEFVIANMGEGPLTIVRAYTTCGCTTAAISSARIPPGKVAEVTLIFDAGYHDTRGQVVRRGLILENNDPEQSVSEIWMQASVRSN